jgi:hypothetical protein
MGKLFLIASFIILLLLKLWKTNTISKLTDKSEKNEDDDKSSKKNSEDDDELNNENGAYHNEFMASEERWKKLQKK